jgi:hypothetical protein
MPANQYLVKLRSVCEAATQFDLSPPSIGETAGNLLCFGVSLRGANQFDFWLTEFGPT